MLNIEQLNHHHFFPFSSQPMSTFSKLRQITAKHYFVLELDTDKTERLRYSVTSLSIYVNTQRTYRGYLAKLTLK